MVERTAKWSKQMTKTNLLTKTRTIKLLAISVVSSMICASTITYAGCPLFWVDCETYGYSGSEIPYCCKERISGGVPQCISYSKTRKLCDNDPEDPALWTYENRTTGWQGTFSNCDPAPPYGCY
jgi:hypothetical protein